MKRPYLTPADAAEIADVGEHAVREWCMSIPGLAAKVVGRWRIDPAALDRVLAGEMRPTPQPATARAVRELADS